MSQLTSHEPFGDEDPRKEDAIYNRCPFGEGVVVEINRNPTVALHHLQPQPFRPNTSVTLSAGAPLADIPLHGVLSFLEQDDLMRSRAVCKQWHTAVMQEGQFSQVGRAFRVMAWRSGQQLTAKNNFRTDFLRVSALLAIATASLFALPFLGYYDGAYQEQQLGTDLYSGIAACLGIASAAVIIAITARRRSDTSCNTIVIAVTTMVICFALSATTFHFSATYHELQALNEAESWTAECPPPPDKSYPASVRFARPRWWTLQQQAHEDNGVRYRWLTFTGPSQQLAAYVNNSCASHWTTAHAAFAVDTNASSFDDPRTWLRYPVGAKVEYLNELESRHMTYQLVHHSDGAIDLAEYRNISNRWKQGSVYRQLRLPLLAQPSRFTTAAVKFTYTCLHIVFAAVAVIMLCVFLFVGADSMCGLRRQDRGSRDALTTFNPEMKPAAVLLGMDNNKTPQGSRRSAITRFYQWLLGNDWDHTSDGSVPNFRELRRQATRPVAITISETPRGPSPTSPNTMAEIVEDGNEDSVHLDGWTPRDSPTNSSRSSVNTSVDDGVPHEPICTKQLEARLVVFPEPLLLTPVNGVSAPFDGTSSFPSPTSPRPATSKEPTSTRSHYFDVLASPTSWPFVGTTAFPSTTPSISFSAEPLQGQD